MLLFYIYYSSIQVIDWFIGMQFEHLPYIVDLDRRVFNYKNFFTTYGEHITAGYNIILTLNYFLFCINGYFDNYLSIILNLTNFYLVLKYFKNFNEDYYKNKIFVLLLSLIFLSLANNPTGGMSLSALLGITFTLIAICLLKSYFENKNISKLFFSLSFFLIANTLFLGGYTVGVLSFFLVMFIRELYYTKYKKSFIFFSFFILSLITYIYVFLISNNTVFVNHGKEIFIFNFQNFLNFLLLMIGNSFLGKAFFESTKLLWPYYSSAILFIIWSLLLFRKIIRNNDRFDIMIIFMVLYPISTIFFTALFRHSIGGDPFGQWYFKHISFIPLITYIAIINTPMVSYFNYQLIKFLKSLSVFLIFVFVFIGNYYDIRKSPYVAKWKMQFFNQAPDIMFNSQSIDRSTHFNSMFNEHEKVHKALIYFYENNLWIFRKNEPHSFIKEKKGAYYKLQIICPVNSIELHLLNPQIVNDFKILEGSNFLKQNDIFTFVNQGGKKNFYEFEINQTHLKTFKSNLQCY